jgi:Tfp pilus assembly protein PilV
MTIVEVLIAVLVLAVGVLAFATTSAATIGMLSRGNRAVKAAFYAQERLEILAATPCQLLASGTAVRQNVYNLRWVVSDAPGGNSKRVAMAVTYPAVLKTTRVDTLELSVLCIR